MQATEESIEQTAQREVREETGFDALPIELVGTGSWTYQYGGRDWDETCYFFLMRLIGGDTNLHDGEFEKVEWVPISRSGDLLFYESEQRIAERARDLLTKRDPANFE